MPSKRPLRPLYPLLLAAAAAGVVVQPPAPRGVSKPPRRSGEAVAAAGAVAVPYPAVPYPTSSSRGWENARQTYCDLMQSQYLLMSSVQAAVLRGPVDLLSQGLRCHGDLSLVSGEHALALASIAFVISGWGGATWLRTLEGWLPGRSDELVLKKTAADYTMWAPFANSCYLLLMPLLLGQGVEAAASTWQAGFGTAMGMEMAIFMPFNLFAFKLIPPHLRPPVGYLLSGVFTLGLSNLV